MISTLFGLKLAPLYLALAIVESDRGATSSNVYQIRDIYIRDVNRIMQHPARHWHAPFSLQTKTNRQLSEDAMAIYWNFWGIRYEHNTGNRPTYETLARIHNGGPQGYKNPATLAYWVKVHTALLSITPDEADRWMANRHTLNYQRTISNRPTKANK